MTRQAALLILCALAATALAGCADNTPDETSTEDACVVTELGDASACPDEARTGQSGDNARGTGYGTGYGTDRSG